MKPCLFFWIENEKKMEPCQSFWFKQKNFWWNLTHFFGLRLRNNDEALPTFFELRTRNDDEALPNFLDWGQIKLVKPRPLFLNWEREIMMEPCLHLYNEQEYFWWSTRNIFDLTQANKLDEVEDSLAKTENKWSKDIMLTRHARKIKVRLSTGYVFSSLFWTILENIQQLVLLH